MVSSIARLRSADPDLEIAVLVRTNAIARPVLTALEAAGQTFELKGTLGFYERPEVKDLIAYLKLLSDPEDRPTVLDYVKGKIKARLYPVGRLDFASEGLIILTNDGAFTKLMTQAGIIPKVYHVKVAGKPDDRALQRLRRGAYVDNERLAACTIEVLKGGENPWYEVTLHQGRNQQIRRMFQSIGHPVEKLRRVRIGSLEDEKLKPGAWRFLTEDEVNQFKRESRK